MTPPSAPGKPSVTDRGLTGLTLAWTASTDRESGIAGYDVVQVRNGGTSVVATTDKNTTDVTGLTADTKYTFAVLARNGAGLVSTPSATVDLVTPGESVDPPTAPGTPTAADVTDVGLALTWGPSTDNVGVAHYRVFVFGIQGAKEIISEDTAAEVAGLSPSSSYQIAVVAEDALGNVSDPSPTINVTTVAAGSVDRPPTAPGKPMASNVTSTSVTLTWKASTDDEKVTGYTVLMIENGEASEVAIVTDTTTTITELQPGTAYTFAVLAEDPAGHVSARSPTLTVTTAREEQADTAPTAPGTPVASEITSDSVTLTWTASTDDGEVTEYDVLLIEGSSAAVVATVADTTATITDLEPNTAYTFAVVAHDDTGHTSPRSSFVNVTTAGSDDEGGEGGEEGEEPIGACRVSYSANSWGGGFTASISITNTGTETWRSWELNFAFPSGQRVSQGWSAQWDQNGEDVIAKNLDWNGSLAPGQSTSIGFNGSYQGSNDSPEWFTVNGADCVVD